MEPRPPAAVAVDEWPLVRLGISQALRAVDIAVVAEVASADEGVRLAESTGATYLILGNHRDLSRADAARRARSLPSSPHVLVLADHIERDEVLALRQVGIDALLPRSVSPAELADAVRRVAKGERVVAPALLSLLVGALGPRADEDTPPAPPSPETLTRKEVEVLARLAEGRSNREIADALFVTPATVKSHLAHIYVKLGVTGRQEAMARAVALGLLD
ncbi:MAG TPA: response regulator transcription factor [Acidimicrobiales bacterium]|nr:response regulator transcription factor [Acidimicrobiales bacterium]